MSMKNSRDTVGNRTRDLRACSGMLQQTAPPRAAVILRWHLIFVGSHSETFFASEGGLINKKIGGTLQYLVGGGRGDRRKNFKPSPSKKRTKIISIILLY